MATSSKTTEATAGVKTQSEPSTTRRDVATAESEPVESAALGLQLNLEAALARRSPGASLPEPVIEKWPAAVRAAILGGASVLPWSLIILTVQAILTHRLGPTIY